jgi:membrane protease YdiL (CAAX protease family)
MRSDDPAPMTGDGDRVDVGSGWQLGDLLYIIGTYALLYLAVRATLRLAGAAAGVDFVTGDYLPRTNAAHVGDIAQLLCWPLAIWAIVGHTGSRRRRVLGLTRPTGKGAGRVAAAVCTILVAIKVPLALAVADHGGLPVSFAQDPGMLAAGVETLHGWSLAVGLLAIGPLVAVGEELLYRAALFGWLRGRLPVLAAALLSSLVFAATHGLEGAAFAFVTGLGLAWLYHRSGSLWPGIAVHATNNMTTLLIVAAAAQR